ncbi:MAG: hypothetical protein IKO35_04660, partial [Elusimicrobiaceae bacterium]|nr:hypothetical protein [Elusimicrobiaceae bacterium]
MKITAVQTDLFAEKEDLPAFILRHLPAVPQGAVLAVASKLFALWKGEIIPDTDLATKEALIRRESDFALQTPLAWLTVKDGMVMTNAGIDASNANGKLLLLPTQLYALAGQLRQTLKQAWNVKQLGIV